jgi:integrase
MSAAHLIRLGRTTQGIPCGNGSYTYAELALRSGMRLDVVSRQLGHASISTTANIYLHDSDAAAAEGAELVGHLLREYRGNGAAAGVGPEAG